MAELLKQEWYQELVEECKTIITKSVLTSRWALVEGYHMVGERIVSDDDFQKHAKGNQSSLQDLAKNIETNERTLYYAIQLYKKYPQLDNVPEGKNITMNKLITKYLPKREENKIIQPLPKGEYDLIVIDPPWDYKDEYDKDSRRGACRYDLLEQEELLKMAIPAASDSILWLWTTHKFIWDAKELMEHWGFEYKLILAWDKEKLGIGVWLRCQVEFCLLGIKGKPGWNLTNERDIIREARREHSRKPDGFYSTIEKLCPARKRLDIFGREKREGWDIYGDESDKF